MNQYVGKVLEFHLEPDGRRSVLIGCPQNAVPAPGQYVIVHAPADPDALLAEPVFLNRKTDDGFLAAPLDHSLSPFWQLGEELALRGPLGKGFQLPAALRNLALVAMGNTADRLLPLLNTADNAALFTDLPLRELPLHVEVQPLSAVSDASNWADFIAIDIPLSALDQVQPLLSGQRAPVQLLITTEMPCSGLADCGVCALKGARGKTMLICIDGPVIASQRVSGQIR